MGEITQYKKHASNVALYLAPFLWFTLLTVMLNATSPSAAGPTSILLVFVLIYLLVLSVLSAMLHACSVIWRMLKPQTDFRLRRWYYVLSVIAIAPVLLVALNTLGQLEVLEVILIILLVGLGCFYVLRRIPR